MRDKILNIDELLQEFLNSKDFQTIETLADMIGDLGDKKAIEPLVVRLCDRFTEIDGDIEDAICSALVKLGVMKKTGVNLMFQFLDEQSIDLNTKKIIKKYFDIIPTKYFSKTFLSKQTRKFFN